MKTDFDLIVVGGGLAGLTAGATAASGGASTVVLEAHQPGGRARVAHREGFSLNMGAHALYRGGPGWEILVSLGIAPTGEPPPLARYRALSQGKLHTLPTGPGSLARTSIFGLKAKAQFGALLARVGRLDPASLDATSVGQWLEAQDLRPEVDSLVRALVRLSTYTADVETFSAGAALSQVQIAARRGVVYLHAGWEQLIEGLRNQVEVRNTTSVRTIEPGPGGVQVRTADAAMVARHVVVAVGPPSAAAALLPGSGHLGDLGGPVTAACLDLGLRQPPPNGYVLGVDDPLYGTTQSPPARQSPPGQSVVAVVRYGSRRAELDRPQLVAHLEEMGVREDDVIVERFLASMVVAGTMPRAQDGGLLGRPDVSQTGLPAVSLAGDWVGPVGLLSDAAVGSGHAAARRALASLNRAPAISMPAVRATSSPE
jgi:protoporphyrinogen oxidase